MARRDGGAARDAVALRGGGGQTRAVAPRGHAAPCADASALTPRALWGTRPRAASLGLLFVFVV